MLAWGRCFSLSKRKGKDFFSQLIHFEENVLRKGGWDFSMLSNYLLRSWCPWEGLAPHLTFRNPLNPVPLRKMPKSTPEILPDHMYHKTYNLIEKTCYQLYGIHYKEHMHRKQEYIKEHKKMYFNHWSSSFIPKTLVLSEFHSLNNKKAELLTCFDSFVCLGSINQ